MLPQMDLALKSLADKEFFNRQSMMSLRTIPTCHQIEWKYVSNQETGNGKEEIRFFLKYLKEQSEASELSSLLEDEPR